MPERMEISVQQDRFLGRGAEAASGILQTGAVDAQMQKKGPDRPCETRPKVEKK